MSNQSSANPPRFLDRALTGGAGSAPIAPGVAGTGTDRSALSAFARRHPVPTIWAAWSLVLLLITSLSVIAFQTQDPDDFLRLMEVRDLLAGQSWFDVTQYRMNPPAGGAMHWSRLVDVPIAAALIVTRALFAEPLASKLAMVVVPIGQLLLVMTLMWRLMTDLGAGRHQRLIAVAIVPLFPLLLTSFAPMRIDHHGWQAIAALGCTVFFVRTPNRRSALLGGGVAALWLSISLEGLPLVVVFAALYAVRHLVFGERDLAWFLTGLAATSVVVHRATRPVSELFPHCDSVGWPHLAAFGAAALLAHVAIRCDGGAGNAARIVRLAFLAAIGIVAGALIVVPIGICAINPFATIDPVMERYWHGVIFEGLPITSQLLSVRLTMAWTLVILVAAIAMGLPDRDRPHRDRRWFWLTLLVAAATPIGLLVMRESVIIEMLTVPFSALLIARYIAQARAIRRTAPRILATVALPLVATPTLASAAAKPFDTVPLVDNARTGVLRYETPAVASGTGCELPALSALPPSRLFATLDVGPEILVKTQHTIVASGYHRNMAKMRDVVEAFSGDPARAAAIVRADRGRFVVLCVGGGDTAVFRSRRPDNLANGLVAGRVPAWLERVPIAGEGFLRVYRVR